MGEHRLCKPRVRGSSPLTSTILHQTVLSYFRFFDIAYKTVVDVVSHTNSVAMTSALGR